MSADPWKLLRDAARARAAREEEDRRWEARVAGAAPPDAPAERAAEADEEEAAFLRELTAPRSAADDEVFLARLGEAFAARAPTATEGGDAVPPSPRGEAKPVARRPRRGRMLFLATPVLAAAAAVALWVGTQRAAPAPVYTWSLEGADSPTRGADTPAAASSAAAGAAPERRILSPGARLRFVAQPQEAAPGLAARAFAVRADDVRAVVDGLRVSPTGSVLLEAPADATLGGASGPVDLVVFIGPLGWLPTTPAEAVGALRGGTPPEVRVLRVPLARP